jgi:hypothetical protein
LRGLALNLKENFLKKRNPAGILNFSHLDIANRFPTANNSRLDE